MQKLSIFFLFLLATVKGNCQLSITGTQCAARGTTYQYAITGIKDGASIVNVCLTGGLIAGTTTTCISDTALSQVGVVWNTDGASAGTITVTADGATQSFNAVLIAPLNGGTVDTTVEVQKIDSVVVPADIQCSPATEGACEPTYGYQWESSPDNMHWTAIDNATGQNLSFTEGVVQNIYYRRKTIEGKSDSIAYSNIAVVFVNPPGR